MKKKAKTSRYKIGGITYTIKYVDIIDDCKDTFGKIYYYKQEINIKNDMTKEREEKTRIHEIVHAGSTEYGIGLDETQVEAMETFLYEIGVRL